MKTLRCAVYTRKSSEEGLELSFNSLHAQREACEAYILSQAGEGWTCLTTEYDDGGISGGHMERPGLKRLIADIEQDKVDIIVVYKVDRLTRSLTDFSKLVEVFDNNKVSFVSVTQAFNTTNSMGRLTLNVLLSFAQFEREVTGERIRDKIAMSRKRGLWTGGLPPLGYDTIDKKLIVNPKESQSVQHIYQRYSELKNVRLLQTELTKDGYVSKRRTTKTGRATGGKPFERGARYAILKNQTYLGLTTHKGEAFNGEHAPIISKALFDKVQTILSSNRRKDKHKTGAKDPSFLSGKIITASGVTLTPTHAQTHGRRYRYYVEKRKDKSRAHQSNLTYQSHKPIRFPASEIERSVQATLANFLSDPITLMDGLGLSEAPQEMQQRLTSKAVNLAVSLQSEMIRAEGKTLIMSLVSRLELTPKVDGYKLHIEARALTNRIGLADANIPSIPSIDVPLRIETCNNGKKVIIRSRRDIKPEPNSILIEALRTAHVIKTRLTASKPCSMSSIANALETDVRQAWRMLKLAFLAPDIQLAILSGTQPRGLILKDLTYQPLPTDWNEQRRVLDFAA